METSTEKYNLSLKIKQKNQSSYRTLPLIPLVEDLLLRHRNKQRENKKFFGNTYDEKYKEYI